MRKKIWRLLPALLLASLAPLAASAAEPDPPNSVFLVAKRHMQDPHFRQTVVLVTQHGGGGPLGVIVNRPTKIPLSKIFPKNELLQNNTGSLYFGGPVSPQLIVFVFRSSERHEDALRVLDNVYLSFNSDLLREILKSKNPAKDLRIFAGYSGWTAGQLQAEIVRGDWYLIQADAETIFDKDPATVWPDLLKRASSRMVQAPTP